jgi:hypothetical protein
VLLLQVAIAAVLVAVVAVIGTKGMVALMGRFAGQSVSRIFTDAEHVVEHHAVPPSWLEKLRRKLRGLRPDCADARLSTRHQARARQSCLRELDRLLSFARKTSIVADEEARGVFVAELEKVRENWRAGSWDEMCAPGAGCIAALVGGDPEGRDAATTASRSVP